MNFLNVCSSASFRASVLLLSIVTRLSSSSGVLEVRISAFSNAEARDAAGECCQQHQERSFDTGAAAGGGSWQGRRKCQGECRTFFRACVTVPGREFSQYVHRQQESSNNFYRELRDVSPGNMSSDPKQQQSAGLPPLLPDDVGNEERAYNVESPMPCSIGVIVTDVVANNSLEAHDEGILDIRFPFDDPWPGRVGLILEAWHDVTTDIFQHSGIAKVQDKLARLVARVAIVDTLEPKQAEWSAHWYQNDHIQLDYALKVDCKQGFDGPTCTDHTKPTYSHHSSPSSTGNNPCVCKEEATSSIVNKRQKRDISSPMYDLTSRSSIGANINGFDGEYNFHQSVNSRNNCKYVPIMSSVDVANLGPTLTDSVVKRLSNMFMETVERSASLGDDQTYFAFPSNSQKPSTGPSLEESPLKALMNKLTGVINSNAKVFSGFIREDGVVEGRQMVLRVASMINETVQMISPVLTAINALVTILRASRYLLLMANFMGL